jgi:hypothetical protein
LSSRGCGFDRIILYRLPAEKLFTLSGARHAHFDMFFHGNLQDRGLRIGKNLLVHETIKGG